jgi:chromosome partitioning protein
MTTILSVANQKGGCGKTNVVLNLAHALGLQDKRVLMIDLDPQGSLTACSGVENHKSLLITAHELILTALNDEPLPPREDYIITKGNVDLIPCNIGLSAIEDKLRDEVGSEMVLSQILDEIKDDYDVVIIDTAPSLSLLTICALAASDGVIITISPQYLSAVGLNLLTKTNKQG